MRNLTPLVFIALAGCSGAPDRTEAATSPAELDAGQDVPTLVADAGPTMAQDAAVVVAPTVRCLGRGRRA